MRWKAVLNVFGSLRIRCGDLLFLLNLLLHRHSQRFDEKNGITIHYHLLTKEADAVAFLSATCQAIRLVEEHDTYRKKVIKKHIKRIADFPNPRLARYHFVGQVCEIDFRRLQKLADYQVPPLKYYACLLAHEATHGYIDEKRIPYLGGKKRRIESICNRQAYKLAIKLSMPGDRWPNIFLASPPAQHKKSFRERLKQSRDDIRERIQ